MPSLVKEDAVGLDFLFFLTAVVFFFFGFFLGAMIPASASSLAIVEEPADQEVYRIVGLC